MNMTCEKPQVCGKMHLSSDRKHIRFVAFSKRRRNDRSILIDLKRFSTIKPLCGVLKPTKTYSTFERSHLYDDCRT